MTLWTPPATAVPGGLTSAYLNTNVRDNSLNLREIVTGVNAEKIPAAALAALLTFLQPGAELRSDGTSTIDMIRLFQSGANRDLFLDLGAATGGATKGNLYIRNPDGTQLLALAGATGKLTGKGIFTSSELTIGAGAQASVPYGFPNPPRWVGGSWSSAASGGPWPPVGGGAIAHGYTFYGTWNADEVQSLIATGATSGTFTLNFGGNATAAINWNDTAATVATRLNALTSLTPNGVACSGGPLPNTAVTIAFQGAYARTPVPLLVVGTTALVGGAAAVTRTTRGDSRTGVVYDRFDSANIYVQNRTDATAYAFVQAIF